MTNSAQGLAEKIAARSVDAESGCREWVAGTSGPRGYGMLSRGGGRNRELAHRLAYELAHGPIPAGIHVLHKCDNPRCVRVEHLFLGSAADNVADMVQKRRHVYGEATCTAKLTEAQAASILADRRQQKEIAAEFGVSVSTVSLIKSRKLWKHITLPSSGPASTCGK